MSHSRRRQLATGALATVVLLAGASWAADRVSGLRTDTQARNPIVRWEWLFLRDDTPGELWDATLQHLQLTLLAVAIGTVVSAVLAAVALRLGWTYLPITAFAGFLYTVPSIALFGLLVTYYDQVVAAEVALVGYTLLILVRNMVAGIAGVPAAVTDAADGLGMSRVRRLVTVELPIALPVIIAGVRVATVTTVGLVGITAVIQLGGLGSLIFDGFSRQYYTKIVVGSVLSVALAALLDLAFHGIEAALTPWLRRRSP